MGKKKKQVGETSEDGGNQGEDQGQVGESSSTNEYESDPASSISMSQELKDEGNKLFQRRDLRGALVKYEKALKLLPRNHADVSYLRSNMAACYMQMGRSQYPRAIRECDLALEVTPRYSKALLKRARCYEALNRLDLALKDVNAVVETDPNNATALEISEKVKIALEKKGLRVNGSVIELPPDYVEPINVVPQENVVKEKGRKKKSNRQEEKAPDNKIVEKQDKKESAEDKADDIVVEKKTNKSKKKKAKDKVEEKKDDIKEVIEVKSNDRTDDLPKKAVKFVFGEDIRCAQLPAHCSFLQLRETIYDRFPGLGPILVKYRDHEGDLVTITCDDELRWAETGSESSIRLYIIAAAPEQDQFFERLKVKVGKKAVVVDVPDESCEVKPKKIVGSSCIEDWIVQFAKLFKNHLGFESDRYPDFHDLGMKFYSEALEETVTCNEAQDLFNMAGDKFQEMSALALFHWGNVLASRARKKVYLTDDFSKENICERILSCYEWAKGEFSDAGEKYVAAIQIKPDFYEAFLALGQQQFEQAKLSWYHALSSNVDLQTWSSTEVLQLYNDAEDNIEKGMQIFEASGGKKYLSKAFSSKNARRHLQYMGLHVLAKNISSEEVATQQANMKALINLLWGTMLYERSIVEFKIGSPSWNETLGVAAEKFELAGASSSDISSTLKDHCSNNAAADGPGFNIEIIVQAWSDINETKRWKRVIPSFRLEPLLRRRASNLDQASELP
ncbi:protein PHOX1 [Arachis stenosperma]|uniref:protein PHOX1 n=1 Tax=Arachis stenosperma TaxID=217475 RepID=UPI0025ACBCA9|nr:protein PHOX1 [Arachis stenosperma]